MKSRYLDRGPFEYDYTDDVLSRAPGTFKCFEHHWTVGDYMNAVIKTGCRILLVDEFDESVADWEGAPLAGLPQFLLVVARKGVERDSQR